MLQKKLYPKTERVSENKFIITEKLDWSNLWIFKLGWKIFIAQRNNCYYYDDQAARNIAYKWLIWRIEENKDKIDLHEWSWVFGEWIWMWQLKYWNAFDKRFYIFAKANIDDSLENLRIIYKNELFMYPFISQTIPSCMWVVPIVDNVNTLSIEYLNDLYDRYLEKVNRPVEWFIIRFWNKIEKYVRNKGWKIIDHHQ